LGKVSFISGHTLKLSAREGVVGHKVKFVLSDLHIGAGFAQTDNTLENFVADEQFVAFLQQIAQQYKQNYTDIELIINGDFLAFLQVPAVKDFDPTTQYDHSLYLDSSEEASVQRLNLIYRGHQAVFVALSEFMQEEAPRRRITIIKGNQDVHFFWPLVKNRLRSLLNASGTRSSLLLFAEEFVSREKIYVEHGHQYTEWINNYPDFRDPRQPDDLTCLVHPLGSQIIIDICSTGPAKFALVNNIKPLSALLWYAVQYEPRLAAKFLAHLTRQTSTLTQNGSSSNIPISLLFENLQNEEACYHVLLRSHDDSELRHDLYQYIQSYINHLYPDETLGLGGYQLGDDLPTKIRGEQTKQHQALQRAATEIAQREGSQVVLFGHSHRTCVELLENGASYLNTGCWTNFFLAETEALGEEQLHTDLFAAADLSTSENLSAAHGTSPLQLPYVRIDYDETDLPIPHLLDFAMDTQAEEAARPSRLPHRVFGWLNRLRS